MASQIAELQSFLFNLMTNVDHNTRQQLEKQFEELKLSDPESLVLGLLNIIKNVDGVDAALREFSCLLLRRLLIPQDAISVWESLGDGPKASVKSDLMAILVSEKNEQVQRKICDIIGVIGAHVLKNGSWPELLPFMFKSVMGNESNLRERSLSIFAQIGHYIAHNLVDQFEVMRGIFDNCLDSSTSPAVTPRVQSEAFSALFALLEDIQRPSQKQTFVPLVPKMLQALSELITKDCQHEVLECLDMMIGICESYPKFYRADLQNVVNGMLSIIGSKNFDHRIRRLALEFMVTMTETSPQMLRSMPNNTFVTNALPVLAEMTLEMKVVKDDHWGKTMDDDDVDDYDLCEPQDPNVDIGDVSDSSNSDVALESIDRIARAIGHKRIIPPIFEIVEKLIKMADWKPRYAALMIITHVVEAMSKKEPQLEQVTRLVCEYVENDPNPRVRFAGIQAIGEMCIDCGPEIQRRHHAIVLPALETSLGSPYPRMQAHASLAIVNFAEGFNEELLGSSTSKPSIHGAKVMGQYLERLLSKLFMLLEHSERFVQENVLTAIAATANSSGNHFEKYYDKCMPVLKQVFKSCGFDKENTKLRGKAIECVSLIGASVGKEQFGKDAVELMQGLDALNQHVSDPIEKQQILSAWSRIAKCLQKDFEPYLGAVLPTILETAKQEIKYEAMNLDNLDDFDDEDNDKCHLSWGDKFLTCRTSDLDDKIVACQILLALIHDLKEICFPFLEQATDILVAQLAYENNPHGDLRAIASAAMPDLISCAALAIPVNDPKREQVHNLANFLIGKLLMAMKSEGDIFEVDLDIIKTQAQSLKECIACAKKGGADTCPLDDSQCAHIIDEMFVVMKSSIQRRAVAAAENQVDEDLDDDAMIALEQTFYVEEELHFFLSEIIGELLKSRKQAMASVVDSKLVTPITDLSHENCKPSDRRIAVFLIDDIIEHVGLAAEKNFPFFLDILLKCAVHQDVALRQAAIYGLGVAAKSMSKGTVFPSKVGQILSILSQIIQDPSATIEENGGATDNAISAVGKIAINCETGFDRSQAFNLWLSNLPLKFDVEESNLNVKMLVEELEKNNSLVLGENNANLMQIAMILIKSIASGFLNDEEMTMGVNVVKKLQPALPQDSFVQITQTLSEDEKQLLQQVFV